MPLRKANTHTDTHIVKNIYQTHKKGYQWGNEQKKINPRRIWSTRIMPTCQA